MYEAYNNSKDLYAMIAQSAYDNDYKDNLEFWPEGTELEVDGKKVIAGHKTHKNPSGKERRSTGKVLLLAATYGMSGKTAGDRLGKSAKEGQALLDNFFMGFPKVKEAIDYSKKFLVDQGYVEDFVGRRRRLTDIYLPPYEAEYKDKEANSTFNPFLECTDRVIQDPKLQNYLAKAQECRGNTAFNKLAKEALTDGIILTANTGRIAQAERQCFNARIQGSAASLTKMAMINIYNSELMRKYNAHLIITVHDEVLVECPACYAEEVEKLLPQIMVDTAKPFDDVPQACDPANESRWYISEYAAMIQDKYKKYCDKMTVEDALEKLYQEHNELDTALIKQMAITGEPVDF